MTRTQDIRNIALLGHGASGKTSLAEAILHAAGATTRLGSVDEKTSVCDYYEEEKNHQHSIQSAVVHATFKDKLINIIDTPGAGDLIGPAILSIPAVDTAVIVISAAAGIQTNTRKLFNLVSETQLPVLIVINKIDAENADLAGLLKNIHNTFGSRCRCADLPDASGSIIDCVANSSGQSPLMDVGKAHTELIESIIEADDALMESYLSGEQIPPERISSVFLKALTAGTLIPVVFTDCRREKGIAELLELVVRYSPSPADARPLRIKRGDDTVTPAVDINGPLAALVFRTGLDPRSNMKYSSMRIFSGTLRSDTAIARNEEKKSIRPGHVMKSHGAENNQIEEGVAGDIVTVAKIDELQTGDLIHDGSCAGTVEMPPLPEPMYSLALEPAARGDEQKISSALEKLREEDPTLKITRDAQTKELIASGLGDLHLRIMLEKLRNRFKLSVTTKQPKIPYRETISVKAEGHYRHKKQTGGAGQFGEVYLRVEPAERGSDPPLEFSWDIFGGSIPSQYEPAIVKGINDVMQTGAVAGFPMQDIKVSVYDGKHHPVDSKEVAFRAAGKGAFIDAVQKAKPVLLEPMVDIEVSVPSENIGDITGDLSAKRGRVLGQEMLPPDMATVKAQVPLAEVTQYNSQLKSITGGRGSYSMSFSHYEPVPPNVQQQVIAASGKNRPSV
jgi:elongation factor G